MTSHRPGSARDHPTRARTTNCRCPDSARGTSPDPSGAVAARVDHSKAPRADMGSVIQRLVEVIGGRLLPCDPGSATRRNSGSRTVVAEAAASGNRRLGRPGSSTALCASVRSQAHALEPTGQGSSAQFCRGKHADAPFGLGVHRKCHSGVLGFFAEIRVRACQHATPKCTPQTCEQPTTFRRTSR